MSLSRTYPIVLPSGGTSTPGSAGANGADGTSVLHNTVASAISVSALGETTLSSYTVTGGTLAAGDVLEAEALFTATNASTFAGSLFIEIDGNEVTNILLDNTGLQQMTEIFQPVPNPALSTSQYAMKIKVKFLVKSASAQIAMGSFHPISWGVPEKSFMPVSIAANLNNAVDIVLKSNLSTITGAMSCIYFKITKESV